LPSSALGETKAKTRVETKEGVTRPNLVRSLAFAATGKAMYPRA